MVIWSELRMAQYRDNDHVEDASHFITSTTVDRKFRKISLFEGMISFLLKLTVRPWIYYHSHHCGSNR